MYLQAQQKDIISFNVMLKAWGRACQAMERQKHGQHNGHKATINNTPSIAIYTPRDAAEHLTKCLMLAEEACQGNSENCVVVPDETSYNIAIDAWAKSAVPEATQAAERLLGKMIHNPRLEPSSITYNAVLDSHAHSSDPDSLLRMNKIWKHMQKLADNGSERVRPNLRTVNMILTACVRKAEMSKEQDEKMACAKQAQMILDDIKARGKGVGGSTTDFAPDVMTYSIVMDAFARVGSSEAAKHAERLMMELKQAFQDTGDVRKQPNFRTYTTLIGAWSRTSDPTAAKRAEELVEEMEQLHAKRMAEGRPLSHGEETTKPNARTFTALIHAWSRSHDSDKAKRVLKILMKMRELAKTDPDCAPLLNSYNQAIDACAKTRGEGTEQVEALKIAFAILKTVELDPNVRPNEDTYTNIIKAAAYLLPDGAERNKIALAAFDKAKASGKVSIDVVRNLRKAVDNQSMRAALGPLEADNGYIDYTKIPPAWSKNVFK